MTFEDKPTFENVSLGHCYSRRLELTCIFERGLVSDVISWFQTWFQSQRIAPLHVGSVGRHGAVPAAGAPPCGVGNVGAVGRGLTLVNLSAQLEPFLTQNTP
jgi:hypothetical protein